MVRMVEPTALSAIYIHKDKRYALILLCTISNSVEKHRELDFIALSPSLTIHSCVIMSNKENINTYRNPGHG
uniref:Uncharacterized protein n=1 Tax=Anguilla anguilla TaxID=7936 RepID=A0A0E9UVC3_ANGAN